ncbi:MAG: DNA polymerase III subunit delta' [Steroidobacteraceae bacterium]
MNDVASQLPQYELPLPWQRPLWLQINHSWKTHRLPHAILLHGAAGLGKLLFAQWLAKALLCEAQSAELLPCGYCASCKLYQAGSHPDLVLISPEENKQQISVDQIRAANERLGMTSARSGYRLAIIEPAHQMTVAAANGLLKTLEEPGQRSLIILVTAQPSAMLPTIRSRCQQMGMATPSTQAAQDWLEQQIGKPVSPELLAFACGAPLRALEYTQGRFDALRESMSPGLQALTEGGGEITQMAQSWADEQLPERLSWLDGWMTVRIRREILRTADPVTRESLQSAAQVLNISALFQALDRLRELKAQLRRTALQRELALETVLLMMQRALNTRN